MKKTPAAGPALLPDGLLLIDKPAGITSHDVVDRVRNFIRPMKVGHTGTLDPFATGLLPLCLGRATRLSRFLSMTDKSYEGEIQLGIRTATYDCDGEVLYRADLPDDWRDQVEQILPRFRGRVKLIPPPFSAKKVMGKPLYEFARADIHIKRKPVESLIRRFDATEFFDNAFRFQAEVSAGTYLRSMADALGTEIGCGAHLRVLRRLGVGRLSLDDAVALDQVEAELDNDTGAATARVRPLRAVPLDLPTLLVNARGRAAVLNGRRVGPSGLARGADPEQGAFWRVEDGSGGDLLGIAETVSRPGSPPRPLWRPTLVFPPSRPDLPLRRVETGDSGP